MDIEDLKADWKLFARLFVLVMVPFFLGAFVVPHTELLRGEPLSRPSTIPTSFLQIESYEFTHVYSVTQSPTAVNSIFPFSNYLRSYPAVSYGALQLCFQDNGSYLAYPNGTTVAPALSWNVALNNDSLLHVPYGEANCAEVSMNEAYSLTWDAAFPPGALGDANLSQVEFIPQVIVYPAMVMDYGILQGMVFIPAFYLFVFYPSAGIIRKIRDGMMEQ
jgi:hypothetical protein